MREPCRHVLPDIAARLSRCCRARRFRCKRFAHRQGPDGRWPYYNLRDIPLQCKTLEPAASFNTGYYGETDLGANLINFHKYIDAQLAFSDLPANNAQVRHDMPTPNDSRLTGL